MTFSIGNGRYCKLFPGNAPPRRVLIEDLSEPGVLSSAFIQGLCEKKHWKITVKLLKAWQVVLISVQILDNHSMRHA